MDQPYEIFIALRYLRAKRKQTFISLITFISIAGVAVGVMALTISLALMTGFEQDIRNRIFSGSAHITLVSRGEGSIDDVEGWLQRIAAIEGVEAACPVVQREGALTNEFGIVYRPVVVSGFDPEHHEIVVPMAAQMVTGDGRELGTPTSGSRPAILLGKDLASSLAVDVGDLVRLIVPTPTLTPFGSVPRPVWMKVAGVFDAGFFEYNVSRACIPLTTARKIFRIEGANQIEIRAVSLAAIEGVESRLREIGGGAFFIDNLMRQNRSLLAALKWEKLLMFIVISLIVLVAALNIVSTLILMVMEKVRDIGILVAMGATSRGILSLFLLQGLVIGLVGTLIGVLAGVGTSLMCDHFQLIPLDPDVYFVPHVPFRVRVIDAFLVSLLAVVISILATLYPAWRASRLDPVEALRHG